MYSNVHLRTTLKPVTPKAQSLQCWMKYADMNVAKAKTTVEMAYGQKPKCCYNGCLVAKPRRGVCQTTIHYGVAKAKRVAPTSNVEGEEIV